MAEVIGLEGTSGCIQQAAVPSCFDEEKMTAPKRIQGFDGCVLNCVHFWVSSLTTGGERITIDYLVQVALGKLLRPEKMTSVKDKVMQHTQL